MTRLPHFVTSCRAFVRAGTNTYDGARSSQASGARGSAQYSTLDLVCKSEDELDTWLTGLRALLPGVAVRDLTRGGVASAALTRDIGASVATAHASGQRDLRASHVAADGADTGHAASGSIGWGASSNSAAAPEVPEDTARRRGRSPRSAALELGPRASSFPCGLGDAARAAVLAGGSGAGTLFAWGLGMGAAQGPPLPGRSHGDASSPAIVLGAFDLDVYAVSCGTRHMAALSNNGAVYTWGAAATGALGHGPEDDQAKPRQLAWLQGTAAVPTDVACGDSHTLLATSRGELYAWGAGGDAALLGLGGHGAELRSYANPWAPTRVLSLPPRARVRSVTCGPHHSALLTHSNALYTWGEGFFGALGHGDKAGCGEPREVAAFADKPVVAVACGVWHTAAVAAVPKAETRHEWEAGTVAASATTDDDSSGGGDAATRTPSSAPAQASSVQATPPPPLLRETVGALFTWGDPDKGKLGHGDREAALLPRQVRALEGVSVAAVACGTWHTVAMGADGRLFTCGRDGDGLLGRQCGAGAGPAAAAAAEPGVMGEVALLGQTSGRVVQVACGIRHTLALTSRGEVYSWGLGANGRLGHGSERTEPVPRLVERLRGRHVRQVSCGATYSAAIVADDGSGALQRDCARGDWELLELLPKDADTRVHIGRGRRVDVRRKGSVRQVQSAQQQGDVAAANPKAFRRTISSGALSGSRTTASPGTSGLRSADSSSDANSSTPSRMAVYSLGASPEPEPDERSSSVMVLQRMLEQTKSLVAQREAELEALQQALADAGASAEARENELQEARAEAARCRAQLAARSRARHVPGRSPSASGATAGDRAGKATGQPTMPAPAQGTAATSPVRLMPAPAQGTAATSPVRLPPPPAI